MRALVLFDVDGTLLAGSGSTHVAAFALALRKVCGAPDPFTVKGESIWVHDTPINGLVDAQIAALCLATAADNETAAQLTDIYRSELIASYSALVAAGGSCGRVQHGVVELLDELVSRGNSCGLLTGNTEAICATKMMQVGLAERFVAGGFGGVIPDRSQLFVGALERASEAGVAFDAVCYVGDTPLDIAAGRRAGIPVVAVATGRYLPEELLGAAAVLPDFGNTCAAADAIQAAAGLCRLDNAS